MTTSLLRVVGCAFLAGLITACNELPTQMTPAHQTTLTNAPNRPVLHRNSQKYREQTLPHARARSGSAEIQARALLAMNGTATIELTTSDLDASNAPGTIANVQLKAIMPFEKKVLGTWNKGESGVWSASVSGLHRYDRVQAQAVVRGIDRARSDVVTVTERVNLLPDLKADGVIVPQNLKAGVNVPIYAYVRELNGDEGARANCVLYIDNVAVDFSNNIWVANGDWVVCAFYYTFAYAPTHRVTVKVESVKPADWDVSNNTASVDVSMRDPNRFYGTMIVSDREESSWYTGHSDYVDDYLPDYYQHYITDTRTDNYSYRSSFTTWADAEAKISLPARLDYILVSDGNTLAQFSETFTTNAAARQIGNFTVYIGGADWGSYFSIYDFGHSYTTYWSHSLTKLWYYEPGNVDIYNEYEGTWSGSEDNHPLRLGNSLAMSVRMTMADGRVVNVQVDTVLVPYTVEENHYPFTCNYGGVNVSCAESWSLFKSRYMLITY